MMMLMVRVMMMTATMMTVVSESMFYSKKFNYQILTIKYKLFLQLYFYYYFFPTQQLHRNQS